jgi:membrane protein DedA with SNARE-associated domain
MSWWRFLFWNAAGGIVWATAFGVVAYYSGRAVAEAINKYGLYAGIALVALIALAVPAVHVWRKRMLNPNP